MAFENSGLVASGEDFDGLGVVSRARQVQGGEEVSTGQVGETEQHE
ncbi:MULTISPECIES: hypothetical protein [unclassified Streptomyces]